MAWSSWRLNGFRSLLPQTVSASHTLLPAAICAGSVELLVQTLVRTLPHSIRYCVSSVRIVGFFHRHHANLKRKGLVASSMAELKRREVENGDSQPGELKDLVDHWVEVIDEWVEHLDQGMGGTAQAGADPDKAGRPPDPAPGPALGTA